MNGFPKFQIDGNLALRRERSCKKVVAYGLWKDLGEWEPLEWVGEPAEQVRKSPLISAPSDKLWEHVGVTSRSFIVLEFFFSVLEFF